MNPISVGSSSCRADSSRRSAAKTEGGRWRIVIVLLLLAALFPATTFAQSSNRWLLIFDISSAMHSRAKNAHDIMEDLLNTGMHGQIRRGDTIGIWTFNDKLHAGEAPLQVWSPQMSQITARHTLQYLDNLHYGKSSSLDIVLTNMFDVVDASDFITVILFSDGSGLMKGTPFDDRINAQYKENYRQMRKQDMPIVTVLQAMRGNFTTNTVNFGPWPVNIPLVPPPPAPKTVTPETPQAPKPAPPPPTVPPLIYDGRKDAATPSLPPPTTENSPSTTAAPADSSSGASSPTVTEQTAAAPKAETPSTEPPTTASAEPAQPAPAPVAEVSTASDQQSKPAATPAPVAQNESEPPPSQPETDGKPAVTPVVIQSATPPTPVNLLSGRNIGIFSVAFTVIVVGLLIMSARRSRSSETSLITRSLDREKR